MRPLIGKKVGTFILMLSLCACSSPESKLVGRWVSDKTATVMEFSDNKTGIIHLRGGENLPPDVPFTWTMQDSSKFTVMMVLPGLSSPRSGKGALTGNDALVLEDDPFKKVK